VPNKYAAPNRLCEGRRKTTLVLSGPRRAQAGSMLADRIGPKPELACRKARY